MTRVRDFVTAFSETRSKRNFSSSVQVTSTARYEVRLFDLGLHQEDQLQSQLAQSQLYSHGTHTNTLVHCNKDLIDPNVISISPSANVLLLVSIPKS